ncbi:hypothetical protein [Kitasatospora sp. NPDC006786]|uniref:hypothetical protein n=1 Tax=unclassified Kitasatospora TaxID=2633591 RepID=UPI00340BFD26
MVNWTRMYDCHGDVDRVPELLERVERVEREGDAEAWTELGYRLCLEDDLVFPASFAALPRLVRLASSDQRARALAGTIVRRAAGHHGCDDLFADCAGTIAEFRMLLDRYLTSRPDDYLAAFLDLLAVNAQYHWSAALGDVNIGDYGRYSAIRDWNLGDVERRDLRPAAGEELSGTGRWMHDTAVRDGQEALAAGIRYLFGRAECPRCASVFNIADEYTSAECPAP